MQEVEIKHYYWKECKNCKNRSRATTNRFGGESTFVWMPEEKCFSCGENDWEIIPVSFVAKKKELDQ